VQQAAAADARDRPSGGYMKSLIIISLGVALSLAACDKDDNYYDYLEYSYIYTVLAADTIQKDELTEVVHVYPAGCNYFERIESKEHGDTLSLAALYHFYFKGLPCAHGSGLDTTSYVLHFSAIGRHYLSYWKSKGIKAVQPIYVEE
jgi:hypothetical protein